MYVFSPLSLLIRFSSTITPPQQAERNKHTTYLRAVWATSKGYDALLDRILTDAEQLALATGAAAYRWEDLTKAPVSPSMLLNPRRYGDGAKDLWTTLNCVQENIIRGGQRDRSRRRPDGSRMPKSRAIKGIDEDMKLNKALWEMAEVLRNRGAQ